MAKKGEATDRDQAITDLEEVSDLISEVGTYLADQDMEQAETVWDDAKTKFSELAKNMRDLFKVDDTAEEVNDD